MGWVLFADKATTGKVEKLDSGAVRVRGRLSRTGMQTYSPWPGAPIQDRPIKVFRPPGEVFSDSSVATLQDIPVTVGHPPERTVTAENWKQYAVGHVRGESTRVSDDGEDYLESDLVVSDAEAIKALEGKTLCEISQGYKTELDWTAGVTDAGDAYDAIQTQIVHNHTALLGAGAARAGKGARVLLDSNVEEKRMVKKDFDALLTKKLTAVNVKSRKKVADSITSMVALDEMSEEEITKLVEVGIKAAIASMSAPAEEASVPDAEGDPPEMTEEEKKKKEEEAAKTSNDERSKGAALAKQIVDANAETLAVIDARTDVAEMVAAGFDVKGKTVRELHLAAIENVNPAVHKALLDSKASDQAIAGAFITLKSSRASWVIKATPTTDSKVPEHVANYHKRMNDAYDKARASK